MIVASDISVEDARTDDICVVDTSYGWCYKTATCGDRSRAWRSWRPWRLPSEYQPRCLPGAATQARALSRELRTADDRVFLTVIQLPDLNERALRVIWRRAADPLQLVAQIPSDVFLPDGSSSKAASDPVVRVMLGEGTLVAADFGQRDSAAEDGNTIGAHNESTRYPVLAINDGDIVVERDYLRAVVPLLNVPQAGLSTCLYRARGATFPARWEALGIATDFAPSVLVARALGVAEFALGSTMALRAADLALPRPCEMGAVHILVQVAVRASTAIFR